MQEVEPKYQYDHQCSKAFWQTIHEVKNEGGYEAHQIVTVMVVMECGKDEAIALIKEAEKHDSPDWSEWSWIQFHDFFYEVKEMMTEELCD